MINYLLPIMKGQRKDLKARLITYLLLPLSLVYGFGVFCHRNFYRLRGAYKASKPVISVGNITVGGSGKTPLVIWLARHLQEAGLKPVILIRGYMPQAAYKDKRLLRFARNDTVLPNVSDEADMLKEQIPPSIRVLVGADRIANIRKNYLPLDAYIADDALQHWPLARDLNIVAIDAGNPFGNGFLLPAGILREGLSALKRAHIFVLTKTEGSGPQVLSARLKEINPEALMVESRYRASGAVEVFNNNILPENFLKDKRVVGFCAIGDPFSFESSLENSGAKVIQILTYRDHHVYTKDDAQHLAAFCRLQDSHILVTTHKDAVKLKIFKDLFADIRLVYIPIQLEIIKGSDEFLQKVIAVCRG